MSVSQLPSLAGKVALVTGGSRGIGRGITIALTEAGAKVYVTGRTLNPSNSAPGSLAATEKEANDRAASVKSAGKCIAVQCDHSKDKDVESLFKKISDENNATLDILVNNAYGAVVTIMENLGTPFWQLPLSAWDESNDVGLRSHYIASVFAARLMVPKKSGLIVNISSAGGLKYLFNVPYGVGKAGVDRLAADTAFELRKHGVTAVSLWPGAVRTEIVEDKVLGADRAPKSTKKAFAEGETIEFAGRIIASLAVDSHLHSKTGRTLMTADLSSEYGTTDIDGRTYYSIRSIKTLLNFGGWTGLAAYVPGFIKLPYFALALIGNHY